MVYDIELVEPAGLLTPTIYGPGSTGAPMPAAKIVPVVSTPFVVYR
jgi:hypothetical protein